MTRQFRILFLLLTCLISCSTHVDLDKDSIKIQKIKQHPFLIDHCKKLIVIDKNGKTIDGINIYCDPGEGCNSYLFETVDKFIIIDCNGQWYIIDKISGKISKDEWQWEKQLPKKYLGTYIRESTNEYYKLIIENNVTIQTVYKFKDPNE